MLKLEQFNKSCGDLIYDIPDTAIIMRLDLPLNFEILVYNYDLGYLPPHLFIPFSPQPSHPPNLTVVQLV